MKINNQYNNQNIYKKTNSQKPSFRGYFACPIKELHIQTCCRVKQYPMIRELQEKCGKYFDILVQLKDRVVKPTQLKLTKDRFIEDSLGQNSLGGDEFGQDNKLFLKNNKLAVFRYHKSNIDADNLAETLNLEKININPEIEIEGGNCFFGKNDNGENFILVGQDALSNSSKEDLALGFSIKPDNVFVIPQPEFHLDVTLRPLKYPYILVGDPDLAKEVVDSKEHKNIIDGYIRFRHKRNQFRGFAPAKETAANLKKLGFKPIMVPGIVGGNTVNFMNAIVHQNNDGSFVYITNHTLFAEEGGIDMEAIFEKYLKKAVPDIREVIFINGDEFVPACLKFASGGIHCLTNERPDFKKWETLINGAHLPTKS